jgi:predicted KAP-like P-loop ATPase
MTSIESGALLRVDGPNEHSDELQLRPFVAQLARVIRRGDSKDPLVVSIEAPWGSGKTWCLGELQRQLQASPTHKIAHFNPWLLSDHRQIVQVLLQKIIRCVDINDTEALKEIGRSLRKYVDGVASLAKLAESSGVGVSLGSVTA